MRPTRWIAFGPLALAAVALAAPACAHRPAPPAPPPPAIPATPVAAPARAPAAPPPSLPDPLPSAAEAGADPALAAIRGDAEAVLRAQAEAYWRLFTKGELEDPAQAWRGREGLLSDGTLATVRAAGQARPAERRAAGALAAWLVGERLGRDVAGPLRELSRAREAAQLGLSGRPVSLRAVPALLAGEREGERRRAIARAAAEAAGPLVPLAEEGDRRLRAAARELGYSSALALGAELRGAAASALAALAEEVLSATAPTWGTLLTELARSEGLAREELRARDLPRLLRVQVPARLFPAGRHPALAASLLAGMGIDLSRQANLRLAPGPHPGAPAHSLALPVDPPGDVRLALAAVAGLDAVRAAFHELGAAEYYAHVRADGMESRRLGSPAVPQAFAALLEEVAGAAGWLLDQGVAPGAAQAEARAAAARRLLRARERAARLLAAVAAGGEGGGGGEAELLARATGCPAEPGDELAWRLEPDPLLRAAEGMRAELLAAQLDRRLARQAGRPDWWRAPAAGAWLAEAWAQGAGRGPEELSAWLGERALDPAALVEVVRERAGP